MKAIFKQLAQLLRYPSVTIDTWASMSNDGYIAATLHGLNRQWGLISICLDVSHSKDKHSGESLAEHIKDIVADAFPNNGPNEISIVMDNART